MSSGQNISRRQFLTGTAAAAAGLALDARSSADTAQQATDAGGKAVTKPSVLIIKSDQHNARCLGVNGHPQVRTPNLDQLARDGVNFTRAFVQNPICTPSRMCYLTGQYVHNHGVYNLQANESFPQSLPTMHQVMRKAGYKTGIVGHVHVKKEWIEPSCDQYRDLHGNDNAYNLYLEGKGLKRDESPNFDGRVSELSFEDSYEGYVMHSFESFLQGLPDDRPFFYQMDPLHPHSPYIPCKEFWDMYDGELVLPPSADENLSAKPINQRKAVDEYRKTAKRIAFEPRTYEAGRLRKLRGYFGCISQVDHLVGLARKKLREIGREENTIIVYCTDHGDFALEHGFLEKSPGISYDAILRTPFIWFWPGGEFKAGSTVEELVESVDLFPTICKLIGIDAPNTVDGVDFSPMLKGDTKPIKDFVVAEFPLSRTIRTKEWKLCHRPRGMFPDKEDDGELYNVAEDPWEMNNLYHDPKHKDLREDLRRTYFDFLQFSSRYGNVWPSDRQGEDGKSEPFTLREATKDGRINYF